MIDNDREGPIQQGDIALEQIWNSGQLKARDWAPKQLKMYHMLCDSTENTFECIVMSLLINFKAKREQDLSRILGLFFQQWTLIMKF